MPHLSMHSPIGDLTIFEDEGEIVAIDWGWVPDQKATPLLKDAKRQLDDYFDGALETFDLPLRKLRHSVRRFAFTARAATIFMASL